MRKALNDNPVVQMAVIGVVAVIFAVMLFSTVIKKDEPVATDPASSADAAASADPAAVDPVAAAPDSVPADPAAAPSTPVQPATPAGASDGLLPTKGLPKDLLVAYAKSEPIALLVIDPKGIADRQVEAYTERLASRKDIELFVVDVADIVEYSRITSGLAVSRAPALVVIRPRKLTDDVPTATVSYGFRSPRSIEQAIDDALYEGGSVSSYP